MASVPDAVRLLTSIDATLKQILQVLQQAVPKPVADESELMNPQADEVIKIDPRDWSGESYKGAHLSAAPPAYLELLAKAYDWFAEKNDRAGAVTEKGTPKSEFDRRTARRARGFAKRQTEPHAHGAVERDWLGDDKVPF